MRGSSGARRTGTSSLGAESAIIDSSSARSIRFLQRHRATTNPRIIAANIGTKIPAIIPPMAAVLNARDGDGVCAGAVVFREDSESMVAGVRSRVTEAAMSAGVDSGPAVSRGIAGWVLLDIVISIAWSTGGAVVVFRGGSEAFMDVTATTQQQIIARCKFTSALAIQVLIRGYQ